MRQGPQNNRRGRGRGRKPQNPLARNFESNGPDVKIRGTAAHIAEKYMSLARDALSSGDIVGAESYLQHAEHYNRIIMAAQQAQPAGQSGDGTNGSGYRGRDDDGGDEDDIVVSEPAPAPRARRAANRGDDQPRGNRGDDQPRANGGEKPASHDGNGLERGPMGQDEEDTSEAYN